MTFAHNTPFSRGVAITLLLAVIVAIFFLLLNPLLRYYEDNRKEIAELSRKMESYERIANSRAEVEKLFASMRPGEDTLGYYLKGSTKALASAELQAYVRTIIDASAGSLVSTQPIVRGERESERMVKVNVRMSGDTASLVQVFYRLANGVPVLLMDEVLVRRNKSTLTRRDDAELDDQLDIQFTLTGFVKESVT